MRERVRRGGSIAAVLLVSLCLGCGAGIEGFDVPRPADRGLPPAELEGVTFEGYRGELREVSVTAEQARIDLTARVADLERVALAFTEEGRGRIEVAAPAGALQLEAEDFTLSGGVVGSTQNGERFSTDTVRYVAASRELVSSSPVELRRNDLRVRANGMTLGLDSRRLRLVGQVRAEVANR